MNSDNTRYIPQARPFAIMPGQYVNPYTPRAMAQPTDSTYIPHVPISMANPINPMSFGTMNAFHIPYTNAYPVDAYGRMMVLTQGPNGQLIQVPVYPSYMGDPALIPDPRLD